MKYTIIDERTQTYKFARPQQIREALERYKVAETKTDSLGLFGLPFTGKKISMGDLDVLKPFLNAYCDFTIRIGTYDMGTVETGVFSEVCCINNEYALVKTPREIIFLLAVETYLTCYEAAEVISHD